MKRPISLLDLLLKNEKNIILDNERRVICT